MFYCEYCGKEAQSRLCYYKRTEHHFCNHQCSEKWHKGSNNLLWKGGRQLKPSGYIIVFDSISKKFVYEHRLIAERMLGRKLLPTEEVHHLNEDKQDNGRGNLLVMDAKEHQRYHLNLRWSVIKTGRLCKVQPELLAV